MKTIFSFILLLVCFCSCAQKATLQISYLYYLNGHNVVSVTALSGSCDPEVRISWLDQAGASRDSLVSCAQGTTIIVQLPGVLQPASQIKCKSDAPCSSTGWVSCTVPGVLEVNIVSFRATRKQLSAILEYELYFSAPTGLDYAVIEKSLDGRSFQPLHFIRSDDERSFIDYDPASAYYRIHTSGGKYSQIIYVPGAAQYRASQLALYDTSGRYLGVVRRYQDIPIGRFVVVHDGISSRIINRQL